MEKKFIKKYTRSSIVTTAVVCGIALIVLVMLTMLLKSTSQTKALVAMGFTMSLVLITTFAAGIMQIRVFNDYKGSKKALEADGIFSICLAILIVISTILFGSLQAKAVFNQEVGITTVDIRYFIAFFAIVFAIWKGVLTFRGMKEKHYNWWVELISTILWFALAALVFATIFASEKTLVALEWAFVGIGWAVIVNTVLYQLYSYIFKTPTYLETPEAIEQFNKDEDEREDRRARLSAMMGGNNYVPPVAPAAQPKQEVKQDGGDIETKLAKLNELLEKGVITKEEYDEKRKKIINDNL